MNKRIISEGLRVQPASHDHESRCSLTALVGNVANASDNTTVNRKMTSKNSGKALQSWEATKNKMREQLVQIRSVLQKLQAKTKMQKNVSRDRTTKMVKIADAVEVGMHELERMRQLRQRAL